MSWNRFLAGSLAVILLFFAKAQLIRYWVPIEFSYFLIFFVLRSSGMVRALFFTFILSLSLDLLLQTGQIKGLGAMSQLALVYLVMNLKRHVVPAYEDLFLLGFFAFFYLTNYYMRWILSNLLGVYFPSIPFSILAFLTLFHTSLFGLLLLITLRFRRDKP